MVGPARDMQRPHNNQQVRPGENFNYMRELVRNNHRGAPGGRNYRRMNRNMGM